MNPYTPPNEPPKPGYISTRRRSPLGNRRQPDAVGAVLVAILVFVMIVVGLLFKS